MIDYIKGELAELTPAQAVVEAYGVGYALNISLNTYEAVQGKKEVKLYVHESLVTGGRDDSYTFFGFASKQERDLYRLLIVDLKDKIMSLGIAQELPAGTAADSTIPADVRDEAVAALTMLGFSPAPTAKVVTALLTDDPSLPVEQVVKMALKQIK